MKEFGLNVKNLPKIVSVSARKYIKTNSDIIWKTALFTSIPLVIYLLVWAMMAPGNSLYQYDFEDQYAQAIGSRNIYRWKTPLGTLLMKIALLSPWRDISLITLLQSILLAIAIGFAISRLYARKYINLPVGIVLAIIYSTLPSLLEYSQNVMSDTFGAIFMLIYITLVFELFITRCEILSRKRNVIFFILITFITAGLRANFLLPILFTTLILLIFYKPNRLRVGLSFVLSFLMIVGFNTLIDTVGKNKIYNTSETFNYAYAQIGAVYHARDDGEKVDFPSELEDYFNQYHPNYYWAYNYVPGDTGALLGMPDDDRRRMLAKEDESTLSATMKFVENWAKLGVKNPSIYAQGGYLQTKVWYEYDKYTPPKPEQLATHVSLVRDMKANGPITVIGGCSKKYFSEDVTDEFIETCWKHSKLKDKMKYNDYKKMLGQFKQEASHSKLPQLGQAYFDSPIAYFRTNLYQWFTRSPAFPFWALIACSVLYAVGLIIARTKGKIREVAPGYIKSVGLLLCGFSAWFSVVFFVAIGDYRFILPIFIVSPLLLTFYTSQLIKIIRRKKL